MVHQLAAATTLGYFCTCAMGWVQLTDIREHILAEAAKSTAGAECVTVEAGG